jgi:hypothetical protein
MFTLFFIFVEYAKDLRHIVIKKSLVIQTMHSYE